MLYRGNRLGEEELASLVEVQRRLRTVALALVSFHQVRPSPSTLAQVEHSFDRSFLAGHLEALEEQLKVVVGRHLTQRSVERVEQVFGVMLGSGLLEEAYLGARPDMVAAAGGVVEALARALDAGAL